MKASSEQLTDYQRIQRQLTETSEMADTMESRQQALIALQQNDISTRTEVEKVTYIELRQRRLQAELVALRSGQELIELQLKSIEDQIIFSQSELKKILDQIADERTQTLKILDVSDDVAGEVDARTAWLAEFLDVEEKFWKTRYLALSTESLNERNKALDTFRVMSQTADVWLKVGKTLADEQLIKIGDSIEGPLIHNALQRIERLQNLIELAVLELEGQSNLGFSLLNRLQEAASAIWGAELYLVEDTASYEGKKVSTFRAITFGKLIRLALILIAGWLALKFLARRARILASRFQIILPQLSTRLSVGILGLVSVC